MASITFVDGQTAVPATWLNDVNTAVYNPAATIIPASAIVNTPAGNISSTNVQAALNELDSEKIATTAIGTSVQAYDTTLAALASWTNGTNKIPYTTSTDVVATLTLDATTTLGTSDTVVPTQKAVKTYTDNSIGANPLTISTAQASTSGTAINFLSIPAWVKRITVNFSGVSLSGTDSPIIQIGGSGGIETTGYLGASSSLGASGLTTTTFTTGFGIYSIAPSGVIHGSISLVLLNSSTNTWVASGTTGRTDAVIQVTGGTKDIATTLDRIRIATTGSNTFDAGSINILYE